MWSNISAPKSHLKSAQVGQQSSTSPTSHGDQSSAKATTGGGGGGGSSPLMRYKHAVCASQSTGLIYIHGGRFGNGLQLDDDVWRFDPHENSWLQLHTAGCRPPSLQEHTLVEHEGCLYLFGGQVSAANGQENSFWRLDLASNEWSSLNQKSNVRHGAYVAPLNRRGHSAVLYRDSMYIFGGFEDFRGSSSQLWQYDLLNERWELRNLSSSSACQPEPRHSHSAVVFEDSMFVFGGLSNLKPLGDLWRWSWRDKRWYRERSRGQSPGPLHGHSAIQAFGSMFVFGGERQNGRTTRSLWRLDLRNLSWQRIRPKGPKPNPSTWHAAVANPMHALDQANFLIEGEELAQEGAQQQQLPDDNRLCRQTATNSSSDNCFYATQAKQKQQQQQQQQLRRQEAIPVEPFRPNDLSAGQTSPERASCQKRLVSSAYASEHQLNLQTNGKTRGKRRIKLHFFKRANKSRTASKRCRAMEFMFGRMPSSWSAANMNATTSSANSLPTNPMVKRHSVKIGHDLAKKEKESEEVEMELLEGAPANARILDNLDTDIKQMFRATQMNPSDDEFSAVGGGAGMKAEAAREENEENSLTGDGNLESSAKRPTRDTLTHSQLSSYATGLAPGSRLTLTSQSYRTAQEQLTSQSSDVTLTAQASCNDIERPAASRLAEMRQRRSMHQFNRRSGGPERRARPKSEIVQSLIERADARIKHFYTPLFQPEQQRPPPFNANDPILGPLQNHRMFERSKRASGSILESRGGASQRSEVFADTSKRHTIHQTTTYYNLYFADESRKCGEPRAGASEQQVCDELTSASSATSTSTIRNASAAHNALTASYKSTTAALVGVRDGSNESSAPRADQAAKSAANQDTDASLSSSFLASSHQTITSQLLRVEPSRRGQASGEDSDEHEDTKDASKHHRDHDHGHDEQREEYSRGWPVYGSRHEEGARQEAASEMGADNTSLSFSVIAEFEEDDMLQYSSPTDSERRRRSPSVEFEDEHEDPDAELADCAPNEEAGLEVDSRTDRHEGAPCDQLRNEPLGQVALKQQKSASSGYDSIRSSYTDANSPQHRNPSNGTSQSDSSNAKHSQLQSTANTNNKQYATASTVDSLQTLTNSSGCSAANSSSLVHSSPAGKSLALSSLLDTESALRRSAALQARSSSQPRQMDSSPAAKLAARLFGKRQGAKTRYWQLCMFVMGGKQQPSGAQGSTGAYMSEPINIWRLYI